MLVSDFVESRLSELQESYSLYLNQFESRSYSSFDSLLIMVDRLTVEASCLRELAIACCPEFKELVLSVDYFCDSTYDLSDDLIKSLCKPYSRAFRR